MRRVLTTKLDMPPDSWLKRYLHDTRDMENRDMQRLLNHVCGIAASAVTPGNLTIWAEQTAPQPQSDRCVLNVKQFTVHYLQNEPGSSGTEA